MRVRHAAEVQAKEEEEVNEVEECELVPSAAILFSAANPVCQ